MAGSTRPIGTTPAVGGAGGSGSGRASRRHDLRSERWRTHPTTSTLLSPAPIAAATPSIGTPRAGVKTQHLTFSLSTESTSAAGGAVIPNQLRRRVCPDVLERPTLN